MRDDILQPTTFRENKSRMQAMYSLGDIEELRAETSAWAEATHSKGRGVDWQFKIDDARVKPKTFYP